MSSLGAILAILACPNRCLNGTFSAFSAIPEGRLIWTGNALLSYKIVIAFFRAGLACEGGKIPIAGHITFYALFSIIVRILGWTLAYFIDVVQIRVG